MERVTCAPGRFAVFFFQAEDGIRDLYVIGVQTCALPIYQWTETQEAAQTLGVRLESMPVRGLEDFDGAFATAMSNGVNALLTLADPLVSNHPTLIEIGRASCRERV